MASAADRDEVRLGVLASGTGSLLEAVIEAGLDVTVVVADRQCRALEVATAAGVPAELVQRGSLGPALTGAAYTGLLVERARRLRGRRRGHGGLRHDFQP